MVEYLKEGHDVTARPIMLIERRADASSFLLYSSLSPFTSFLLARTMKKKRGDDHLPHQYPLLYFSSLLHTLQGKVIEALPSVASRYTTLYKPRERRIAGESERT